MRSAHEERAVENGRAVLDELRRRGTNGGQPAVRDERATRQTPIAPLRERFPTVGLIDLIERDLPEQRPLLAPWLLESSLSMVHAYRGVGKTWFSLAVAYAVATGGEFLGWAAAHASSVLYVDGEMPARALQTRLKAMLASDARDVDIDGERLQFITPDLLQDAPPDLGDPRDQEALQAIIDKTKPALIIIDNISCLVRSGGAENDAESWLSVQGWALRMRKQGIAVLFVHHQGKNGAQRGTSKREDVLDTVISLRRPGEYKADEGAAFVVEFEKARHLHGGEAEAFEARLETVGGLLAWTKRGAAVATLDRVVGMTKDGMSAQEIAVELGVSKSTAYRAIGSAVDQKRLPESARPKRGGSRG